MQHAQDALGDDKQATAGEQAIVDLDRIKRYARPSFERSWCIE